MKRVRFSLAGMMVVVFVCGISFAALRYASELWASALFSADLVLLLTAIVAVCLTRERRRAGWLGCAVFGWGYLALAFGPGLGTAVAPPPLLTTVLFQELFPQVHPAAAPQPTTQVLLQQSIPMQQTLTSPGWTDGTSQPATVFFSSLANVSASPVPAPPAALPSPSLADFRRVGHALALPLAALVGAALARRLFARQDPREPSEPTPVAPL